MLMFKYDEEDLSHNKIFLLQEHKRHLSVFPLSVSDRTTFPGYIP